MEKRQTFLIFFIGLHKPSPCWPPLVALVEVRVFLSSERRGDAACKNTVDLEIWQEALMCMALAPDCLA